MTPELEIDAAHARRFLVLRHRLRPPRSLPARATSVLRVVETIGSLQVDPLAVTGARNHDVVLAARIAGYRSAWLEKWLYGKREDRKLVEVYNKSLGIVPVADLPYHRVHWERTHARFAADEITARAAEAHADAMLARLDREGPLSSRALAEGGDEVTWGWGKTTASRVALHMLFRTGRIATVRREGNTRIYDRIERVLPEGALDARADDEAATRHRLLSRFHAVGLLSTTASPEIWVGTSKAQERARLVRAMVADGTLIALRVRSVDRPLFMLGSERAILERARERESSREVAMVAPLDPFVWDRRLLRDLFGLEYTWQVYTPKAKRTGGYYELPVLYGDAVVGTIEPRLVEGTLEITRLSVNVRDAKRFARALDEAIDAHAALAGADRVRFTRAAAAALKAQSAVRLRAP